MPRTRASISLAGCAALLSVLAVAGCSGNADPTADPTYEGSFEQLQSPGATGATGPTSTASPAPSEAVSSQLDKLAAAAQSAAASMDTSGALAPRTAPVLGADISWPQCPAGMGIPDKISTGQPMPTEEAEYVVIGLTNGPGFHANPCLADQVAYAKGAGLLTAAYAVASFPDDATVKAYGREGPYPADTPGAALLNTGYLQAKYNVDSMRNAGLASPMVWIDVEPVSHYEWSNDPASNALVVIGAAKGYVDAGLAIGVYSTPHLWETVVGDLTLGPVPEWRAAGQTSMTEALSRCGPDWSIQGGPAVLGQWVEDARDRNITCPGAETRLGDYFAAPPEV